MSEIARALIAVLFAVAIFACAWFGRAWYDGTMITRTDADLIAQGRVDEAALSAVKIKTANDATRAALARVQAPARVVSYECPPGLGAVSDDALARLRAATVLEVK